jgi:hypothetical protein
MGADIHAGFESYVQIIICDPEIIVIRLELGRNDRFESLQALDGALDEKQPVL